MRSSYWYRIDEEIYRQGDVASNIYQVLNGAIRMSRRLPDGRRQIGAFYFPGDVFGFEPSQRNRWSAEAIVQPTIVRRAKRLEFMRKAQTNLAHAHILATVTARDLLHAQEHAVVLGRLAAAERMAAFFLQMNDRIGASGEIELPMSREDVADYLGLTVETVAREISKLHAQGILKRNGPPAWVRRLSLRRPERLQAMLPPLLTLEMPAVSEDVIDTIFPTTIGAASARVPRSKRRRPTRHASTDLAGQSGSARRTKVGGAEG
ncbi:MAG: helix-turn-helix domain-containing protein [Bradyrhizobium sp.]|uniref:helix-turn-helix domain-containing protein n=1 Tax=Bradyrhizobium sp. TaxID=376 RepID=UPI0025BEEC63|nr:helix-turn-helix domain-containing protein [Bradyrhizobium sp.]MBI5260661.1 helix-turn-helix domain-containing protein [Bradyrhizobium sp.]